MNQLINSCPAVLNNIGRWFCDYGAGIFIQSSILIILFLIIDLLLRKRVRATFRYWMWMLVLLKLMLPPAFSLPTGIGYWFRDYLPAHSSVPAQVPNMIQLDHAEATKPEDSTFSAEIPQVHPYQSNPEPAAPTVSALSELEGLTWQAVVFIIWFLGVAALSILLIYRMFFVRRLIAQSEPSKNRYAEILDQCCQQLGVKRKTELRLSGKLQSPAVCGFFRPVILIPAGLLEKLSPDKLRAVLIHELAHIKRGDLWVNCVQTFLQIIYFYNPLVWLANAVIRRIREQAVDEMVLVTLGDGAKDYSNTLIDIAETVFFKANLSLRLIGVVESKKALRRRIRHMLNRPIPKNARIGILGLITVLAIGAVLLPMAEGAKKPGDYENSARDTNKSQVMLTWWMAAVEEPAAKKLISMSQPVSTKSKVYRANTISGDDLFDLMSQSQRQGDVLFVSRILKWLDPSPKYKMSSSWADTGNLKHSVFVGYGTGAAGPYKMKPGTDGIQLDLEYDFVHCNLNSGSRVQGSIFYTGRLKSGDALVYTAKMPEKDSSRPWHIVVYQAVEIPESKASSVLTIRDAREWIKQQKEMTSLPPFTAKLANGVTVELVGVCEHPSEGKQWWRPDGSKLSQRPFEKLYQRSYSKRELYELALKIDNAENRKLSIISKDGGVFNLYPDKIWGGFVLSEGKKMLNQSIGIAQGPWKTIMEANPMHILSFGDIAFGKAFESDFEGIGFAAGVTVTHTVDKEKVDYRIIAVDQKSNIHTSSGGSGIGNGSWMQTTVHFKDLQIDEIKEFQFQSRPYQWVEFKNVSLKPNFKTDVQVEGKEVGKDNKTEPPWIGYDTQEGNLASESNPQIAIDVRVFLMPQQKLLVSSFLHDELNISSVDSATPLMKPVQLAEYQARKLEE